MRTNYHSHTFRCKHSTGTEEEYVLTAMESGYAHLGFADHCPWPFGDGFVSGIRMDMAELDGYVQTVRSLGHQYAGQIKIYCGLECEYFPSFMPWLADMKQEKGLDFLILGNHFDGTENGGMYFGGAPSPRQMRQYLKQTIAGMETGLYAYVAHPDLFLRRYLDFDQQCREASRTLCRAAKALNVPLEYNLLGLRFKARSKDRVGELGYPCEGFWEIAAQEGAMAIIGIDAHHRVQLTDPELFDLAALHLERLGIERVKSMAF